MCKYKSQLKYLNLGCGYRTHPDWINVDIVARCQNTIAYNLNKEIPFSDSRFEVIYHSHLLEHFSQTKAEFFLKECVRVLRPKGILRVVVPDLEQIARLYLQSLEKATAGYENWSNNYNWMLLEMYDQVARNQSGGKMMSYLFRDRIPNLDFVLQRCGTEAKNLVEAGNLHRQQILETSNNIGQPLKSLKQLYRFVRYPQYRREFLLERILGNEYEALQIGRFRQSGEVHQWMYDRYSLQRLLEKCGLEQIVQRTATSSYIPNWSSFNLDTEPDGTVYKPDSLYMEAIKPAE